MIAYLRVWSVFDFTPESRSISRWNMLIWSKRVNITSRTFNSYCPPQCAITASKNIPKNTYLWELIGVMSSNILSRPSASSIEAHPIQGYPRGPRLLVGPARLVNHSCNPNATVSTCLYKPMISLISTVLSYPRLTEHRCDDNSRCSRWRGDHRLLWEKLYRREFCRGGAVPL
jgi:hypothetical protein